MIVGAAYFDKVELVDGMEDVDQVGWRFLREAQGEEEREVTKFLLAARFAGSSLLLESSVWRRQQTLDESTMALQDIVERRKLDIEL